MTLSELTTWVQALEEGLVPFVWGLRLNSELLPYIIIEKIRFGSQMDPMTWVGPLTLEGPSFDFVGAYNLGASP